MPKNAVKTSDIFMFLKGGGIRGYNGPITVQNIKQSAVGTLVYDPNKHINAYKLHIEICKYFYEMHLYDVDKSNAEGIYNLVKIYEYSFSNVLC